MQLLVVERMAVREPVADGVHHWPERFVLTLYIYIGALREFLISGFSFGGLPTWPIRRHATLAFSFQNWQNAMTLTEQASKQAGKTFKIFGRRGVDATQHTLPPGAPVS